MVRDPPAHSESREAGRGQNSVRAISRIHRQNSEFKFPPKIWSARTAACSAFPPQNPDSARIRPAECGKSSRGLGLAGLQPNHLRFVQTAFFTGILHFVL